MKKGLVVVALGILWVFGSIAMAAEKTAPSQTKPSLDESNLVTVNATVEKIDLAQRLVTLKGPEGNEFTVKVDPAVKNLPQVKVGDELTVKYYQSLLVRVEDPGKAQKGIKQYQTLATAQPGQKPAGMAVNSVTVNTTIDAIDKAAETVTLKGPKGNTQVVKVRDPANLEKVAVGDHVIITYTEALAVDVAKPGQ
jgi:Cu/Ag efflux protein CusF